ncbi:hypothetical protein BLA29_010245, partial [Euroglyphus maynei]
MNTAAEPNFGYVLYGWKNFTWFQNTESKNRESKKMEIKNENSKAEDDQNEAENFFQTIGSRKKSKTLKVKPNLPKWIDESVNYSGDIQNNSVGLNEIEPLINE